MSNVALPRNTVNVTSTPSPIKLAPSPTYRTRVRTTTRRTGAGAARAQASEQPTLIMSDTVMVPVPNAIALGAVAIGRQKAKLVASVTGIIKSSGLWPEVTASRPTSGSRMEADATLELNSVNAAVPAHRSATIAMGGRSVMPCIRSAIQMLRPLSLKPRLMAKPPPSKKQISHGNMWQCEACFGQRKTR
jgi:hypothetical protein